MRTRWILACLAALGAGRGAASASGFQGLPPTRTYPLEDIGYIARGARLDFDGFGRLAVVQEGIYAVLNDTVWINLVDDDPDRRHMIVNAIQGADGRTYCGGRKSIGRVEISPGGRVYAVSLMPPDAPSWIQTAMFDKLTGTREGAYFASWNGIAYLDFKTGHVQCHAVRNVAGIFSVGNRVYVSSFDAPVSYIDVQRQRVIEMGLDGRGPALVDHGAEIAGGRALLAESDGHLWVFDGESFEPWQGLRRIGISGRISALQALVDGGVAVAVVGRGLYLFGPDDALRTAIDLPSYHRITDMANQEPGVLWASTEDSIEKVLYGSPLTTFGQKLGLPVSWPVVQRWNGRLFVSSEGHLFEAVPSGPGLPNRFQRMPNEPAGGVWPLAAVGDHLLVGNRQAIFSLQADGRFEPVMEIRDAQHLVAVGDGLCFAIGTVELGVIQWREGSWVEAAPRVPGLPYTPIVHGTPRSVWVEMGGRGVARVALDGDRIRVDTLPNESWTTSSWVNLGVIDNLVVLSAIHEKRRFYDENAERWCDAPSLDALLSRPAQWVDRVCQDDQGVIWASHNEGVITFTPAGGDYSMDTFSFDQVNDRYPTLHILSGTDVWISAGQSLHHVEAGRLPASTRLLQPLIVSAFDTRAKEELLNPAVRAGGSLVVSYGRNDLAFRVFAGGYRWRRAPVYEYRLSEAEPWVTLDSGPLLSFKGLYEGDYRLQVRIADSPPHLGAVATLRFEVRPPWHRTLPAYFAYVLGTVAAVIGVVRWTSHLERKRNRVLEDLVHERTRLLEATMEKLSDETRNAATLAERNRLAGEIHDSLQQGLSGAILQLDTTLKLPVVAGEVRSRLGVIRNMVSYTRQEVQHAVWDMESPLIEGVELGEALQRLAGLVDSPGAAIEVGVDGKPRPVSRVVRHNLMRIAQEATTNAVRHASAGRIQIRLNYAPDAVRLTVSDDGVGFDPERAMNGSVGHFGLRGIRSRAKKMKGRLSIQSSPGAGATIHVIVPLESDNGKAI